MNEPNLTLVYAFQTTALVEACYEGDFLYPGQAKQYVDLRTFGYAFKDGLIDQNTYVSRASVMLRQFQMQRREYYYGKEEENQHGLANNIELEAMKNS